MEIKVIKLENEKEYYVIAETEIKETKYYLLSGVDNELDSAIRKEVGDELVGLDDYYEFKTVIAKLAIDFKDEPTLKQYLDKLGIE